MVKCDECGEEMKEIDRDPMAHETYYQCKCGRMLSERWPKLYA